MSKTLKLIFTVSIILNVIALGLVGGFMLSQMEAHPMRGTLEDYSPIAKHAVARSFRKAKDEIVRHGKKAKRARTDMINILRSPDFDEKGFDRAAGRFQKSQQALMSAKIGATQELAGELGQEERQKLAWRLLSSLEGAKRSKLIESGVVAKLVHKRPPMPDAKPQN